MADGRLIEVDWLDEKSITAISKEDWKEIKTKVDDALSWIQSGKAFEASMRALFPDWKPAETRESLICTARELGFAYYGTPNGEWLGYLKYLKNPYCDDVIVCKGHFLVNNSNLEITEDLLALIKSIQNFYKSHDQDSAA